MRLITTLGFDVTHVLLILTRGDAKPDRVVALIGSVRNRVDPRTETAFTMLKQFANMIDIDVERVDIEVTDFVSAVERIMRILEENTPAVLDIGGGLRLLVLEAYTAYILLGKMKAAGVTVYTALEGMNELFRVDLDSVKRRVAQSRAVDEDAKAVLSIIDGMDSAAPKDILERLGRMGYRMTKQRLSKILSRLVRMGLVEKVERGRYRRKL